MLSTFYKQEISKYDKHIPFIQFEVISDIILAKEQISENDYCKNLDFILISDMDDIEHYVNSNRNLDLDEYLKINVFFIKSLFRDLKKNSRKFYVKGEFRNLLDSYDNEDDEREIDKKFIKFMNLKVKIYLECYNGSTNELPRYCNREDCIIL